MNRKHSRSQIQLYKLIFTMNWEDPESDYKALMITPGDKVMTITSGGCNTLSFLRFDPSEIYTVDINPSQSYLLELKINAMKNLDHDEFIGFLGLKSTKQRIEMYNGFRNDFSSNAKEFWDHNLKMIDKGVLIHGRYEQFVKLVSKFILLIQGKRRINDLFIVKNMDDQKSFYEKKWNTKRTKLIFNLFFNKYILAKRGLKADYFHFDDGSDSFAGSFFNRFSKVLRDIPVNGNYFIHLYLKGSYKSVDEVPDYLLRENFDIIKARLDRIRIVTDDAKSWLAGLPENFLTCFSLSNICELMNLEDTERLFLEVIRTANPGARVCFRNLMIERNVPESLKEKIKRDDKLSKEIFNNDRSFVYSKVEAYNINK